MDKLEVTFTEYMRDIERYMTDKLPVDLPTSLYQEISAYITNRTSVLATDIIRDRDKMWERNIDRMNRKHAVYRPKNDLQRTHPMKKEEDKPND